MPDKPQAGPLPDEASRQLAVIETERLPAILRSEENTLRYPFFILSKSGHDKRVLFERTIQRDGREIRASWEVIHNPAVGIPRVFDKRVFKAVEQLLWELPKPIENPVRLGSLYRIAQKMGMTPTAADGSYGGRLYDDIRGALERIAGSLIKAESTFYVRSQKRCVTDVFHLIDRVVSVGQELPDGTVADSNYLVIGSRFLQSVNDLYLRPMDYDFYWALGRPASQRLYELLGDRLFGLFRSRQNGGRPDEPARRRCQDAYVFLRYSELTRLMPIERKAPLSLARRSLEQYHAELLKTRYLARVTWEEVRAVADDWELRYYPGARAEAEYHRFRGISPPEQLMLFEEFDRQDEEKTEPAEASGEPCSKDFVQLFYQTLTGNPAYELKRVPAKDLALSEQLLKEIGPEGLRYLIHYAVARARQTNFPMQRFGAIESYLPVALGFFEREAAKQTVRQVQPEEARRHKERVEERERQRAASPYLALWEKVAPLLRERLGAHNFNGFCSDQFIRAVKEDEILLDVRDEFDARYLAENYQGVYDEAFGQAMGRPVHIAFAHA